MIMTKKVLMHGSLPPPYCSAAPSRGMGAVLQCRRSSAPTFTYLAKMKILQIVRKIKNPLLERAPPEVLLHPTLLVEEKLLKLGVNNGPAACPVVEECLEGDVETLETHKWSRKTSRYQLKTSSTES